MFSIQKSELVTCSNGLCEIPELKSSINRLLAEVSGIKNLPGRNPYSHSEEFIINEVNELSNIRASNLILYNLPEFSSSVIADINCPRL